MRLQMAGGLESRMGLGWEAVTAEALGARWVSASEQRWVEGWGEPLARAWEPL